MSKIICDMCGTSYPDTSNQCPICGCVRPADIHGGMPAEPAAESSGYNYVKGGRFSKANVKKRNKGKISEEQTDTYKNPEGDGPKRNVAVLVLICMIVLAVIAVAAFIILKLAASDDDQSAASTETKPINVLIPCESLQVDGKTEITVEGDAYMLNVYPEPADTTDEILYESDNVAVALVDANGRVIPVGSGSAVITVTCGEQSVQITVHCDKQPDATTVPTTDETQETTEPTVPETTEETLPDEELRLNRNDITMSFKGEKWNLYNGNIPVDKITWSSEDDKIASIKDGVVTATGSGKTTVSAQYGDQEVSCIIRCNFEDSSTGVEGSGGVGEDGGGATATCAIYAFGMEVTDVTIRGTESNYTLRDADGKVVKATWKSSDSSILKVESSDGYCTLTPVASGTAKLIATYEGVEYTCLVRVYL